MTQACFNKLNETYYELGPKEMKTFARRTRKQQLMNTIHKIRGPTTNDLEFEPDKIDKVFENYYKKLYSRIYVTLTTGN